MERTLYETIKKTKSFRETDLVEVQGLRFLAKPIKELYKTFREDQLEVRPSIEADQLVISYWNNMKQVRGEIKFSQVTLNVEETELFRGKTRTRTERKTKEKITYDVYEPISNIFAVAI